MLAPLSSLTENLKDNKFKCKLEDKNKMVPLTILNTFKTIFVSQKKSIQM